MNVPRGTEPDFAGEARDAGPPVSTRRNLSVVGFALGRTRSEPTALCRWCRAPFARSGRRRGSVQRYCSDTCKARSGSAHHRMLTRARALAAQPRRACPACSQPVSPRASARFCSRRCADRVRLGVRRLTDGQCPRCGEPVTGHAGKRFCSTDCRLAAEADRRRSQVVALEATCAHCHVRFTTMNARRRYCSTLCSNRAAKRRRYDAGSRRHFPRIRYRQRQAIFDRDSWRCGLCGAIIDPTLKWPHPGSPSIDHIDPNGAHEPANWQASHLACNVQAGAKRAAA